MDDKRVVARRKTEHAAQIAGDKRFAGTGIAYEIVSEADHMLEDRKRIWEGVHGKGTFDRSMYKEIA
jgi:putative heme iron utilization protein